MTAGEMTTLCRFVHPSKDASVIPVSFFGVISDVRDVQSLKAYISKVVMLSGRFNLLRLLQPWKQDIGTEVILSGRVASSRSVQFSKRDAPIDFTVSGIVTSVNPVSSKAFPPRIVMPSAKSMEVSPFAVRKALAQT